jgi:hypothetical protein
MAKSDPTQNIVSELKSLNETNNSLKDKILEYTKTAASAMATTATASKSIYQINDLLKNLTNAFDGLNKSVSEISENVIEQATKPDIGIATLLPWEKKRFQAIANIFKNILGGVDKNKNRLELLPAANNNLQNNLKVKEVKEEPSYENMADIFDKIMKISSLPIALEKIYNILLKAESNRIEERKDDTRSTSFKEIIKDPVNKKDPPQQNLFKEKSNILSDFLEKIPLIGNLFKVIKGMSIMLYSASPIIAILSHFLTDDISPWQGTVDLIAKIKTLGGKTFGEFGELILEKTKSIIQWPFKFLKEKIPSIFENIKIPFAETGEKLAATAAKGAGDVLKVGAKGGILSKILGFAGKGLKSLTAIAKRLPIIGSLLSLYFAYDRYKKGDYVGVLLELANVVVSAIPGVGTALSIGLGIISAIRDFKDNEEDNEQFKLNAEKGFWNWIGEGMSDIFRNVGKWFQEKFDSLKKYAKDSYNKIKAFFGFSEESSQVKTLPDPIKDLETDYNKKIKETQKSLEKAKKSGNADEITKYEAEIEKTKKERENVIESIKKSNSELPLPRSLPPTTSLEPKFNNNQKESKISYEEMQLMMDQNKILADQTNILKEIAAKDNNIIVNSNSNNKMVDNNLNIKQNKSDSRQNYLRSSEAATNLLGGR